MHISIFSYQSFGREYCASHTGSATLSFVVKNIIYTGNEGLCLASRLPASVAQLDARPTGDQVVAGSTPAEVSNILSWRLIMKYFLRSFSPFSHLSVSGERMCTILVNRLED